MCGIGASSGWPGGRRRLARTDPARRRHVFQLDDHGELLLVVEQQHLAGPVLDLVRLRDVVLDAERPEAGLGVERALRWGHAASLPRCV